MKYRKQGLRAFGLSFVAVLGLMAFMAAGAQAEAKWLYLETGVLKTLTGESTPVISADNANGGDLTLLVPGKNLKVLCQKVESDTTAPVVLLGSNLTPNGGIAHGHLKFKECETWTLTKNELQKNCTPKSPSAEKLGEILAGGLARLILHPEKNTLVLFQPLTGQKAFTTIEFGELCALFETGEVTGSLIAECGVLNTEVPPKYVGGNCATHRVTQVLKEIPEELAEKLGAGNVLKFGESKALVDGLALVKFGKPCEGCEWSGDAE